MKLTYIDHLIGIGFGIGILLTMIGWSLIFWDITNEWSKQNIHSHTVDIHPFGVYNNRVMHTNKHSRCANRNRMRRDCVATNHKE